MKRSTNLFLGLAALLLVVAYFIIRPTDRRESTYDPPDIQLQLDIAQIKTIEIARPGEYVRMERVDEQWTITAPKQALADPEAVYRLLEGMAKFRLTGLVSSNQARQNVYQVNDGGTKLTVTYTDGRVVSIMVGKDGPTSNQAYIRPLTSNSVYLAKGIVPDLVNKNVREWRMRSILRTDPEVIKLVSARRGGQRGLMRKEGTRWISNDREINKNVSNLAVKTFSQLSAEDFVDTAMILRTGSYLQMEVYAGEMAKFDLFSQGGKKFMKSSTSANIFVISKQTAKDIETVADALLLAEEPVLFVEEPPTFTVPSVSADTDISASAKEVLASLASQFTPSPQTQSVIEDVGELKIHTVGRTETIETIASRYQVTKEQIKRWNVLQSDAIRPGWELYIFVMKK